MKKIILISSSLFLTFLACSQSLKEKIEKSFIVSPTAKKVIDNMSGNKKTAVMSQYKKDVYDKEVFQAEMAIMYEWGKIEIPLGDVAGNIVAAKEANELTNPQVNLFITRFGQIPMGVCVIWDEKNSKWRIIAIRITWIKGVGKGSRLFALP
jgi:hypothetical protein